MGRILSTGAFAARLSTQSAGGGFNSVVRFLYVVSTGILTRFIAIKLRDLSQRGG